MDSDRPYMKEHQGYLFEFVPIWIGQGLPIRKLLEFLEILLK